MGEPGGVTGIMSMGNVKVAVSTLYCSFELSMSLLGSKGSVEELGEGDDCVDD